MPITLPPTPSTWATGQLVRSWQLTNDVNQAIAFLTYRPVASLSNQTGGSFASGGDDAITMETEFYDNWNGHNLGTASQYFAQVAGWYLCKLSVAFAYNSSTEALFRASFSGQSNGSSFGTTVGPRMENGSTHIAVPETVDLYKMVQTGAIGGSGDFVQCQAAQFTGSPVNVEDGAGTFPYASIRWVAATSGTVSLPVPVNPTWPVPGAPANPYITSTFLNANIRDTVKFLLYPPICRATYTGSGSLASQTFPAATALPFTATTVDNYSAFTTGASAGYTAPVSGNYFVYGQLNMGTNANGGAYGAGLAVNGGTVVWGEVVHRLSGGDTSGTGVSVQRHVRLNAGDKVALMVTQSSGSSVAYGTGLDNQCRMVVVWEGA
jgi:hypothetical protein